MKIAAYSDNHGYLPSIEQPVDLLCIAGDFSPLEIQDNLHEMYNWFINVFIKYLMELPADNIIIVSGNHDFICSTTNINNLLHNLNVDNKIIYLENGGITLNDKYIYGNPFTVNMHGWAFGWGKESECYNDIPKCDLLITHQPPRYKDVGMAMLNYPPYFINFGSHELYNKTVNLKIKNHIFGHIHTGNHKPLFNGITTFRNVAIKNEDYVVDYPVAYFEI